VPLPSGFADVPQPGASPGPYVPAGLPLGADLDTQTLLPGDIASFVPPAHLPYGGYDPSSIPGGTMPTGAEALYFLNEAPLAVPTAKAAPTNVAPFAPGVLSAPPTITPDVPPTTVPSGAPPPAAVPGMPQPSVPLGSLESAAAPAPDALYFQRGGEAFVPAQAAPSPAASADFGALVLDLRPELVPDLGTATRPFDPYTVKRDFPILRQQVHGKPLIWLDNAATTQKPQSVIDRLSYFYEHENSNIHRAAHALAARATDAYEEAREKVGRFLNAPSVRDIIFVRGTTEGINLVAQAWGRRNVKRDDEILITWLEHHANIVPWQQLCAATGARLRVAPVDDSGQVILEEYEKLLGANTRIVAMSQVSNALGTVVPVKEMTAMAHRHGACVLVDGAQAVSHMAVDVQAIDCDFYVFSGHKVFGPTGIGAVYGKAAVLANMPPWQGGGNMIADVTFERTIYQAPPERFEAGTGNIADAVGLGAAIDYVESIGMQVIGRYEHDLLVYATERMLTVPGLKMIGTAKEKASVLSFVLDGRRSEDVGQALDKEGIAVRAGHHCAQPILRRYGLESTVRPSLAFYNTCEDVDALVAALLRLQSGGRGL
jgi:cysteine desulfurase/selenocysteine lyase